MSLTKCLLVAAPVVPLLVNITLGGNSPLVTLCDLKKDGKKRYLFYMFYGGWSTIYAINKTFIYLVAFILKMEDLNRLFFKGHCRRKDKIVNILHHKKSVLTMY